MRAVFVGDLHVGSSVALCPPQVDLGEDGLYSATRLQLWIYARWQMFIETVTERKDKIILITLGDLVDGARQHGTYQTWGTQAAQNSAAVELLRPLANVAHKVYGVSGTSAHAGLSGQDDRAIVKELGGMTEYRWRLEIEGKLFDVSHHARRDSAEQTLGNSCLGLIRQTRLRCARTGERRPDYIIRGHAHECDVLAHDSITAALCPAWKLQDEYTRRLNAASLPDIGGLIWENGLLTPHLYPPDPDPITVVSPPPTSFPSSKPSRPGSKSSRANTRVKKC